MSYLFFHLINKRRFRKFVILLLAFTLLSAIIIVPLESYSSKAKITNYYDAFYWAITTVTTVGYGDLVPTTPVGKALTMALQLIGASIFSIIFVVIGITMAEASEHFHFRRTQEKLEAIEDKLEAVHKHLQAHHSLQETQK